MSISPTSRYIPIETEINQEQWDALDGMIEAKRQEVKACRYDDPESALWFMEQLEYFRAMKEYHKHRFVA
jgi:hypothetical protein